MRDLLLSSLVLLRSLFLNDWNWLLPVPSGFLLCSLRAAQLQPLIPKGKTVLLAVICSGCQSIGVTVVKHKSSRSFACSLSPPKASLQKKRESRNQKGNHQQDWVSFELRFKFSFLISCNKVPSDSKQFGFALSKWTSLKISLMLRRIIPKSFIFR